MRLLVFMLIFTTSTATFHKFKPNKLYKHLVQPLFDGAWQRIVTNTILDPIGHILGGGNGKRRKKHHHKHHHSHSEYDEEPEFIHEHEVYINHGGSLIHPGHPGCFHGDPGVGYHPGFEEYHGYPGYPVPSYIGGHHDEQSDNEDFNHFGHLHELYD